MVFTWDVSFALNHIDLTIAVCWNYTTHYPRDIFRLMQAWLFRNPFWTTDRVKGLVTAVPQVGVNSWVNYSEFLPSFYLWIANTFECHKIFWDLVRHFELCESTRTYNRTTTRPSKIKACSYLIIHNVHTHYMNNDGKPCTIISILEVPELKEVPQK